MVFRGKNSSNAFPVWKRFWNRCEPVRAMSARRGYWLPTAWLCKSDGGFSDQPCGSRSDCKTSMTRRYARRWPRKSPQLSRLNDAYARVALARRVRKDRTLCLSALGSVSLGAMTTADHTAATALADQVRSARPADRLLDAATKLFGAYGIRAV